MNPNEYHTFGPPGCGKTTWLIKQIERALQSYAPESVLVASFTRSAAQELVMRGVPIPPQNVGTLHALCYRHFDRPKIAETKIAEFNGLHPEYKLDIRGSVDPDDPNNSLDGFVGDSLMQRYQIARAKMEPKTNWDAELLDFSEKWEKWCKERGYWDFTSLIEMGIDFMDGPPDGQLVGFFDEAQDFTTLEFTLIRRWAEKMEKVIFVGDDDQAIYGFKGGDPAAFIDVEIPEDNKIYLRRSYRLPSIVAEYSKDWIQQVTDREEKEFVANSEGGEVSRVYANYRQPDQILGHVQAQLQQDDVNSVMILASCSYMLEPFKAYMYEWGIPFHNPYRIKRGDWNPIRYKSKKQRTVIRRLLDLFMLGDDEAPDIRKLRNTAYSMVESPCTNCEQQLSEYSPGSICKNCGHTMTTYPLWSPEEFRSFMELMQAKKLLKRGGKKNMHEVDYNPLALEEGVLNLKYQNTIPTFIEKWGIIDDGFCKLCEAAWTQDVSVIEDLFLESKRRALEFPLKIAKQRGIFALKETPQIIIGTIHSVKGGEADAVYVLPDISPESQRQYEFTTEGRDDIIRQFYVAMTRTRNKLFLCDPAGMAKVDWL